MQKNRAIGSSIARLLEAVMTILFLLCFVSACTNVSVQHSDALSYLDPRPIEKCEYQGQEPKYSEEIHIQGGMTRITANRNYARLSFTDNTKAEYVLLLPMDKTVYSLSIWRDLSDRKVKISVRKPVDVILNPPLEKGLKSMMSLLPPESWQGYPSKIVVYNQKDEKRIYVAYRRGTGEDDICWSIADATDLNKKSRRVIESVPVPIFPLAIASAVASSRNRSSDICEPHSYYYSVAFSPDGKYALSGSYDNAVKVWDVASGEKLRVFTGHTDAVESVAFSADGTRVLSGSRDKTVRLWDFSSAALIRAFNGHNKDVKSVAFTPDGRHVLSGSQDGTARIWDISSAREVMTLSKTSNFTTDHKSPVESVATSPDGRYVLSANINDEICLWDAESGDNLRTFLGHKKIYIKSVAFSPNGQYALSGGNDGTMKLWEVKSGWEIKSLQQNGGYVYSTAFSPDGRYILSGNENGCLLLWELSTGKLIRTFGKHAEWVSSVAFSPDGRFILSGSADETIKLWDRESGKEIRTFTAKPEKIPPKCNKTR